VLYAAKSYWPDVTQSELAEIALRADMSAEADYVGSLLFEHDDLVLSLFRATSPSNVQRASQAAGIPCERVMQAVWLGHRTERSWE
jgi:hypothetical protein